MTTVADSIEQTELATRERLVKFPNSPFFTYAQREIETIKEQYAKDGAFSRQFYDDLNIGLMCARELESVDPEYCDYVYAMLETIRLSL